MRNLIVIAGLLLLVACKPVSSGQVGVNEADSVGVMPLEYAKGFQVKTLENGVKLVDVADPQTDEDRMPVSYHFALVQKGTAAEVPEGYTKVEVPVERTQVMTMLQLSSSLSVACNPIKSSCRMISTIPMVPMSVPPQQ